MLAVWPAPCTAGGMGSGSRKIILALRPALRMGMARVASMHVGATGKATCTVEKVRVCQAFLHL